jgi:hypothetical protein
MDGQKTGKKKTLLAKISFLITVLEVAIEVLAHTD